MVLNLFIFHSSGKVFLYVNIRYEDGSVLPVWVLSENMKDHENWETECIAIPNFNRIENVLIGVGACDLKQNKENPQVMVTNLHFDIFDDENSLNSLILMKSFL
jgi:hypothetical protein